MFSRAPDPTSKMLVLSLNEIGQHLLAFVIILVVLIKLSTTIYNLFLGPLKKIPGPILWAISPLPSIFYQVRGQEHIARRKLHDKYGPVVRIAPRELSFSGPEALQEIYGHKKSGQAQAFRDPFHYGTDQESIISAHDSNHTRIRRMVSPAFGDRSLKDAEPRLKQWAAKLRDKLDENARAGADTDVLKLYNCATFDIMGDLTFSENLNMLDNGEYSSWVAAIFAGIKSGSYFNALKKASSITGWLVNNLLLKSAAIKKFAAEHEEYANRRVDRRLKKVPETPDLWTKILAKGSKTEGGLSINEHYSTASIFMIAGTETSATALSGMTYHLLRNPETMQKLQQEIRITFTSFDDIHLETLSGLKYLNAVVQEGLRIYPPLPTSLPRRTPSQGIFVSGQWIPGDVVIGVSPWATVHSEEYFARADEFHPERWLSDPAFANDLLQASQPFSLGDRNCVGKILAYHEMRLLLATVIFHFDLDLCEESIAWPDQKVYGLWEKKALFCKLTAVQERN